MKKFIFIKNSTNVYDSQLGVIDTLSDKYGHESIKTWAKIDYALPIRIVGNSASISSTVLDATFNIDETLILNSLDTFDMVFVGAIVPTEGVVSESTLFENFSHFGVQSDGTVINLSTNQPVDVSSDTWYIITTTFKVDSLYYMVVNNNIAKIVETTLDSMMEGPGIPHEYVPICAKCGTLKHTLFKPEFGSGKLINGKTLFTNSDTLTVELTSVEPVDVNVVVDSNMTYSNVGMVYTFNVTDTNNFLEFSIPTTVFDYFSKDEELLFQYEVTKYG